jgi:alkylation response protein AidB-like acyl-CoA dehydrogenase
MVDYSLNEQQLAMRELAREFAAREMMPVVADLDRQVDPRDCYPWDLLRKASQVGFRTLGLSAELGGGGGDTLTRVVVLEELANADSGFATLIRNIWRYTLVLSHVMNDEQRARFLPAFLKDDTYVFAGGMTEPQSGSDSVLPYDSPDAGPRTTAVRDGNDWVLNGVKHFITNGYAAKLLFIFARTDFSQGIKHGLSWFIVPPDAPGFSIGKVHDKMGRRLNNNAELLMNDCRVPAANLLGELNEGYSLMAITSPYSYPQVVAEDVGCARACFEESVAFARQRVQGGKRIVEHQAIACMLADMLAEIEIARTMMWRAAWAADHLRPYDPTITMKAKVFAAGMVLRVALNAVEIFGGSGVMKGTRVEKLCRDAVTLPHSSGMPTILKLKLGQALAAGGIVSNERLGLVQVD